MANTPQNPASGIRHPASVHQFVAGFSLNDAITNEAIHFQQIFRDWGAESDIFCERARTHVELRDRVRELHEASSLTKDDTALLHLSMGSPVNQLFADLPCRKVILYHNITPAQTLRPYSRRLADDLETGRREAAALAGVADINLAVSQFNATELEAWGYNDVRVLPILLDFSLLDVPPDPQVMHELDDGFINILFVGRGVPNKRIEDLIHAVYWFQKFVEPKSRLVHVGSFDVLEKYGAALKAIAHNLHLEHTKWMGSVGQPILNACYQSADLFLCMSEHEGFCIPLLEAMHFDIPVMAYDAGAVAETMGGAGVLFNEKHFDQIAATIERATGAPTKQAILATQKARLTHFANDQLQTTLKTLLH